MAPLSRPEHANSYFRERSIVRSGVPTRFTSMRFRPCNSCGLVIDISSFVTSVTDRENQQDDIGVAASVRTNR